MLGISHKHLKRILAAVAAALVSMVFTIVISGTLRQVSGELPNYGFYSIRELHIMLRDVSYLGNMVTAARLAPAEPESLSQLARANDQAYVRFVRQDRSATIEEFPRYADVIDQVRASVETLDRIIARGQPFDRRTLQTVETDLAEVETKMNEYYYSFGDELNRNLIGSGETIDLLEWEIIFALLALSAATIGTVLLLINRKETLKELHYLASYDQTTGLHNRNWLAFNGDLLLSEVVAGGMRVKVALIDLDYFKQINDTFGHHTGDGVLKMVGAILAETAANPAVTAFRMGGDEFGVVICAQHESTIDELVFELHRKFNRYVEVGSQRIQLKASLGVASFPHDGTDLENLLKNADHAAYSAKSRGRGRVVRFSDEILRQVKAHAEMESRLKSALQTDEPYLVWQPQFDLATGRLVGAEALMRWHDPVTQEIVLPADFVPVAERSDLILALDRYVIELACKEASELLGLVSDTIFSINLSGKSLQDPGLPDFLIRVLAETSMPPHRLELEITEGVFIGNERTAEAVFSELDALGIRFALDDFGTGFSNLAYLAELRFDRPKIDRSLIDGVEKNQKKRKLLRSILALARALDLEVVAEGVENEEQTNFLIKNRCHCGQGFYFSHPLKKEHFIRKVSLMGQQRDYLRSDFSEWGERVAEG